LTFRNDKCPRDKEILRLRKRRELSAWTKQQQDRSKRNILLSSSSDSKKLFSSSTTEMLPKNQQVGSAGLDWGRLGFDFQPTAGFVKYTWSNGRWDEGVFETEPYVKIHVMSSSIHYGQGIFEGGKAHHCADGKVRLWNVQGNARRMQLGCERMMMPIVPEDMFIRGCQWAVAANFAYVPPYESRGAMYLRPYIFGHGPQLGLSPAPSFHFCVLAIPVSSYYAGGLQPIDALVVHDYDRAAPRGVGHVKAAGNYGSDIRVSVEARGEGYPTVLYLDAATKSYIEEFSVANFVGIKYATKDRKAVYVTPDTNTILRSITNDLLMELATTPEFDMIVERRPIHIDELAEFDEVAGCGTAVVMTGIKSLTYKNQKFKYDSIDTISKLYEKYRAIQFGDAPDTFNWGKVCPDLSSL